MRSQEVYENRRIVPYLSVILPLVLTFSVFNNMLPFKDLLRGGNTCAEWNIITDFR